jgi:hypothetical protein
MAHGLVAHLFHGVLCAPPRLPCPSPPPMPPPPAPAPLLSRARPRRRQVGAANTLFASPLVASAFGGPAGAPVGHPAALGAGVGAGDLSQAKMGATGAGFVRGRARPPFPRLLPVPAPWLRVGCLQRRGEDHRCGGCMGATGRGGWSLRCTPATSVQRSPIGCVLAPTGARSPSGHACGVGVGRRHAVVHWGRRAVARRSVSGPVQARVCGGGRGRRLPAGPH